jgi:hypothetical protein
MAMVLCGTDIMLSKVHNIRVRMGFQQVSWGGRGRRWKKIEEDYFAPADTGTKSSYAGLL